jgi:anti-anti-sigma factor
LSDEHSWLEIREVHDAGRIRVRLRGELDLAGVPTVRDRLRALCERGEAVVLDLDELDFIDMSGMRVVFAAAEEASRDGWTFSVTAGSAPVRRLFELVKLDGHLPLDGDPS